MFPARGSLVLGIVFIFPGATWPFLLSLVPYILIMPPAASIIMRYHNQPDKLKKGAKLTVLLHLAFSIMLIVGFVIWLI